MSEEKTVKIVLAGVEYTVTRTFHAQSGGTEIYRAESTDPVGKYFTISKYDGKYWNSGMSNTAHITDPCYVGQLIVDTMSGKVDKESPEYKLQRRVRHLKKLVHEQKQTIRDLRTSNDEKSQRYYEVQRTRNAVESVYVLNGRQRALGELVHAFSKQKENAMYIWALDELSKINMSIYENHIVKIDDQEYLIKIEKFKSSKKEF